MRNFAFRFGPWIAPCLLMLGGCKDDTLPPTGAGMTCGAGTRAEMGACVSTNLEPGNFQAPLVLLQRLAGRNDHMHLDEVRHEASKNRLYVCSYDFAVVDVSNPGNMSYLLQGLKMTWPEGQGFRERYPTTGTRTGGCINLAVDGEYVFTTHRGNIDDPTYLGGWHITGMGSSLTATQIPPLQEPGTSYEGIDTANGHIYVGLGVGGFAVYNFDPAGGIFTRVGALGGLHHVLGLRVAGNTVFAADGLGGVVAIDVSTPSAPALIGTLELEGAQARDVRVDVRGDRTTLYVAGSAGGLIVVDATNPANMSVIGRASMPASAQRLDYTSDRVYVAAWNDIRVFDVADPARPQLIGLARMTRQLPGTTGENEDGRPEVTSRTLGIAASSIDPDIVFAGNWHVPYAFRIHADRKAPNIYLPEDVNLIDFGPITAGASANIRLTIRNEGTAPLTLTNVWSSSPQFTVEPRQARIEPQSTFDLTLGYTSAAGTKENAIIHFLSDDPAQPLRKAYVVGNQGGLGVGVPLPETVVDLVTGDQWSSTSPENTGKVQLLAYFATF